MTKDYKVLAVRISSDALLGLLENSPTSIEALNSALKKEQDMGGRVLQMNSMLAGDKAIFTFLLEVTVMPE